MKLLIGLGNPGIKYQNTRHNVGYLVLDEIAKKYFPKSKWKKEPKLKSLMITGNINGQNVILAKPITYMNNSGDAVQALVAYYNLSLDRIWVIQDDFDLELRKIRVRQEGSSGGHQGIQSIITAIGSDKIARFKIGIKNKEADIIPTEKFVLQEFNQTEKRKLKKIIQEAANQIVKALEEGIENLSTEYF